jgi:hypothetical protein
MGLPRGFPVKASPHLSTAGRRKVTPALHQAQQLALQYSEIEPVSKAEAKTTITKGATALGLKSNEKEVSNLLFARSKSID